VKEMDNAEIDQSAATDVTRAMRSASDLRQTCCSSSAAKSSSRSLLPTVRQQRWQIESKEPSGFSRWG
jgi:hypothetical protein